MLDLMKENEQKNFPDMKIQTYKNILIILTVILVFN